MKNLSIKTKSFLFVLPAFLGYFAILTAGINISEKITQSVSQADKLILDSFRFRNLSVEFQHLILDFQKSIFLGTGEDKYRAKKKSIEESLKEIRVNSLRAKDNIHFYSHTQELKNQMTNLFQNIEKVLPESSQMNIKEKIEFIEKNIEELADLKINNELNTILSTRESVTLHQVSILQGAMSPLETFLDKKVIAQVSHLKDDLEQSWMSLKVSRNILRILIEIIDIVFLEEGIRQHHQVWGSMDEQIEIWEESIEEESGKDYDDFEHAASNSDRNETHNTEEREFETFVQLKKEMNQFKSFHEKILGLIKNKDFSNSKKILKNDLIPFVTLRIIPKLQSISNTELDSTLKNLVSLEKEIQNKLYFALFLSTLFVFVGILFLFLLVRHIVLPITHLTQLTKDVSSENFDFSIDIQSNDEIGELANSFNNMLVNLDRYQKNLILSKEMAEEANMHKTDFLAKMSHELRTPMHGILSFAQLGLERLSQEASGDDPKSKDMKTFFERIQTSATRLLKLLNDLLEISQHESNTVEYNMQSVNINDIIDNVYAELENDFKKQELSFSRKHFNNVKAYCDSGKIHQVLLNLLSNAIKNSPWHQKVLIETSVSKENEKEFIEIVVKNSGEPIPPDEIDNIFAKFVRGTNNYKTQSGVGLGLAISREIIHDHGGKIWVESTRAEGTHFYFTLPVDK